MLWIALHLPALSLEAFAATLAPAQAGRPAALVEAHRIVQTNAAARALGVQPGLKRATALALAPDLLLGQADAWRDTQALTAVAHAALAFTPAVAVVGQGVRLEVQASLRYFGGLEALLRRLQAALQPLGHQVQWATAPTAAGAHLLARWRADRVQGPHSTALGPLRNLLDDAPVALLDAGREHGEALQGMGLRTLADLRALPRAGLARRFGPALLLDLDRARGDAPEPHEWVNLPLRFTSRVELFTRAERSDQVGSGAAILLARLVAWAQARHGRIARFTLRMHHESRHRHAVDDEPAFHTDLDIALAEPAIDPQHLQQLLRERLGRLPLAAPALELSLHCDTVVPGEAPNAELFPTRASEHAGLTRLVERLQARLGREQVRGLQLAQDHRPERATVSQPVDPTQLARQWAGRGGSVPTKARPLAAKPRADNDMVTRPVWLCPEPEPLRLQAQRPCLDGRPLQLLAGPERIESGWWDGALAARDYYVAQAGDDALVWVYRSRLPVAADAVPDGAIDGASGWFLHGRFA